MKKNYCYHFFQTHIFSEMNLKTSTFTGNLHSKYEKIIRISKYIYLLKSNSKTRNKYMKSQDKQFDFIEKTASSSDNL